MRNGVEYPHLLSAEYVVSTNVTRGRFVQLTRRRTQDDQVLEDTSRCARLNGIDALNRTSQPFAQVNLSSNSKSVDLLAGLRVQFLEVVIDRENESSVRPIMILPVIKAAIRRCAFHGP